MTHDTYKNIIMVMYVTYICETLTFRLKKERIQMNEQKADDDLIKAIQNGLERILEEIMKEGN